MVGVGMRLRVLPIAAMVSCAAASAQDAPRSYAAVVCTSEANGPWTEKVRGTLTRTRSQADLGYKFEGAGQAFDWRFVTSARGNTTVSGPGFLMERFGAAPKGAEGAAPAERRRSAGRASRRPARSANRPGRTGSRSSSGRSARKRSRRAGCENPQFHLKLKRRQQQWHWTSPSSPTCASDSAT
jgi:hypothetical protein